MSGFFKAVGDGVASGAKYGSFAAGTGLVLGVFTMASAMYLEQNSSFPSGLIMGMFTGGGAIIVSPFFIPAGAVIGAATAGIIECCTQREEEQIEARLIR
ncbi:MAG: hypothetical protein P1U61_06100 [Legionellaceae bacterium]|nr:hypothetical protein [Legionellaceae bacterium]